MLNPYTYGARLDARGFSASGVIPESAWIVTTSTDTIDAFLSSAASHSTMRRWRAPPASLFVNDHTYRYDVGTSQGAFEIAAVPEPSSLGLVGAALLGLLAGRRSRRRSAPGKGEHGLPEGR